MLISVHTPSVQSTNRFGISIPKNPDGTPLGSKAWQKSVDNTSSSRGSLPGNQSDSSSNRTHASQQRQREKFVYVPPVQDRIVSALGDIGQPQRFVDTAWSKITGEYYRKGR
ncbi:MAG: hypothetical protein ACKO37_08395 [Vampirovibrionales bacterium]